MRTTPSLTHHLHNNYYPTLAHSTLYHLRARIHPGPHRSYVARCEDHRLPGLHGLSSPLPCDQRRGINLLHSAITRNQPLNHKIKEYNLVEIPLPGADYEIDLKLPDVPQPITTTMRAALAEYVKPGYALWLRDRPTRKQKRPRAYELLKLKIKEPTSKSKTVSLRGLGAKMIPISTTVDKSTFLHRLARAYEIMQVGHAVEFGVRPVSGAKWCDIDYALRNLMHLRPEALLKAMPEQSKFAIHPVSNGKEYRYVLVPLDWKKQARKNNLTQKFLERRKNPELVISPQDRGRRAVLDKNRNVKVRGAFEAGRGRNSGDKAL